MTSPDRIAEIEKRAQAAKSSNSWKTLRENIPYLLHALAAAEARNDELVRSSRERAKAAMTNAYDSGLEAAAKIAEAHYPLVTDTNGPAFAAGWNEVADRIAKAIRSAKKGTP